MPHRNNWAELFAERAAIAEFSGGLPRAQAEAQAWAHCVAMGAPEDALNALERAQGRLSGQDAREGAKTPKTR